MTTALIPTETIRSAIAWFEDFNAPAVRPDPLQADPPDTDASPEERIAEAWREGFLAGRQVGTPSEEKGDGEPLLRLIRCLSDLESRMAEAEQEAAALIGSLVSDIIDVVLPATWAACLPDRVRAVTGQLTPTVQARVKLTLADGQQQIVSIDELVEFCSVMEQAASVAVVSVTWQRGQAELSRARLQADIRHALAPLITTEDH